MIVLTTSASRGYLAAETLEELQELIAAVREFSLDGQDEVRLDETEAVPAYDYWPCIAFGADVALRPGRECTNTTDGCGGTPCECRPSDVVERRAS